MEKLAAFCYTLTVVILLLICTCPSMADTHKENKIPPNGNSFKEHKHSKVIQSACKWLIPNCEECFDSTWCAKCQGEHLALESFWGMECVPECPTGYYEDMSDAYRQMCVKTIGCNYIYNCAECSERYLAVGSYKCDRCQSSYLLFAPDFGRETACVEECPAGFKQHGRRCKPEGCSDFFCSSCEHGWVQEYKGKHKGQRTCVRQCPDGYYKRVNHLSKDTVCDKCKLHCRHCSDSFNCYGCEEGYALLNREFARCVETCPLGYRLEIKSAHHPALCASDKKGCLDKRCNKCHEGYFHMKTHGISQCREECPKGYFKEFHNFAEHMQCSKCIYKCETCTDNKNCQKCKDGYKRLVHGHGYRTYCLSSCPMGYDTIEDRDGQEVCLNLHEPYTP